MKKLIFLTVLLFGLFTQKIIAQSSNGTGGNTAVSGYYLGWSSGGLDLPFTANGTLYQMTLTNGGNLNIITPACGYMINGSYVLWQNAVVSNIQLGVHAGNSSTTGTNNTLGGYYAGSSLTSGYNNTDYGAYAGYSDQQGVFNIFIGYNCGYNTSGIHGSSPAYGDFNTMCGIECGYNNTTGYANCYYGKAAGYYNDIGYENSIFGSHAGNCIPSSYGIIVDSDSFYGNYSAYEITQGIDDVFIGCNAGYTSGSFGINNNVPSNYNVFIGDGAGYYNAGGNYNITLGYQADAYNSTATAITNAAAIGADAWVQNSNQFILGNNSQFIGAGMSTDPTGPEANLEIQTDLDLNVPSGFPFIGNGLPGDPNYYGGTGFSGLKFRDLTSNSSPVDPSNSNFSAEQKNPYPTGVLSVDGSGNIIYIQSAIGSCTAPSLLSTDGAININNAGNFFFLGNSAGSKVNNVSVGWNACLIPPAKLTVLQNSGDPNTIGTYILNEDQSNGISGSPQSLIGLKSIIPAPGQKVYYNVASWFEADPYYVSPLSAAQKQYAIFVPQVVEYDGTLVSGGTVDIGFQFGLDNPSYLLKVNGHAQIAGMTVPSDSVLKKNVTPFKYGLKAIRRLNPVSYKYNGIGGFDSTHTYIGLIAENLARNVPGAICSSLITKDTVTHDTATIMDIYEEGVLYTAINAIKQLDSSTTSHQNTDSVKILQQQLRIDSLVNALASIQTCLNRLCSDAPVHHTGGNGNSGDSNSIISNVQEVMLSGIANAPLLYQNIPNPFSTGTKINYYLPQGTIGATIVFYDTYGNQIKTVPLSQTGNGTLNITPDNLSSGIYSYSLIVYNNVVDTKRMILQK